VVGVPNLVCGVGEGETKGSLQMTSPPCAAGRLLIGLLRKIVAERGLENSEKRERVEYNNPVRSGLGARNDNKGLFSRVSAKASDV
jgi:hypothetical protein